MNARRALFAASAASVPTILLAIVAVEATPHVRGLGFFSALRLVVVAPACFVVALAAAFVYPLLAERWGRARSVLVAALFGLAALVVLVALGAGSSGLAAATLPVVIVVAAALALWVPRYTDETRRSRLGTVAIVFFGAIEIFGVALALASERAAPPSADGLAFEVPRPLFDVDHKFLDLPGGARVHYVDEGRGETLLFLHGNPSWSFQWRDLIHELRGSYRCVAVDYPGFGLSVAPAGFGFTPRDESQIVEEFVDRLGLREMTLVIQDWGGPIGLGLAGRRPELVRRVVLGSTWAWATDPSAPRGRFSTIAGGPLGEFVQMNFDGFASFGVKNGIVRPHPAEVFDLYLRPFRPLDRRGIAAFYPGQINAATTYFAEVDAGLPRLADKKALIFWALRDRGFPRADLERWEATFPKHETVELPNADHFFFEDEQEVMLPKIRAFLAEGAAASRSQK